MMIKMNRFYLYLLIFIFTIILSCEKLLEPFQENCECNSEENKINMIFKYGVTAKNILNTYNCTFTKDMIVDPSLTVCLKLTEIELDSIYSKMNQIDFFNYPDTFLINIPSNTVVGFVTPFLTYYFFIEFDTLTKELFWEDEIISPSNESADNLSELIQMITEMIQAKEEYRRLPSPRGGYL